MKPITRRQFITSSSQATAVIAAGCAVLGFPTISRAQSPGDQIVLALIGAGGRASSLSAGMSRLPGVEFSKFPGEVRFGDQWPHWPTSATRVEIYGTKALMYLGRHGCGWQVVVEGGKVIDQDKGHFPDKWHQPNFIDCLRTRKQPNGDIEQAHHSACLVHLANTSYRVGQKQLMFDGPTERFTNSAAANALLKPAYRKHYRIPDAV